MHTPFPSRFAFATTSPLASRTVPTDPAAKGLTVRAALLGLGAVVLAAAAALAAG